MSETRKEKFNLLEKTFAEHRDYINAHICQKLSVVAQMVDSGTNPSPHELQALGEIYQLLSLTAMQGKPDADADERLALPSPPPPSEVAHAIVKKKGRPLGRSKVERDLSSIAEVVSLSASKSIPLFLSSNPYKRALHVRFKSQSTPLCGHPVEGEFVEDGKGAIDRATSGCKMCLRAVSKMKAEAEQLLRSGDIA